jgi:hypothetical protein
MAFYYKGERGQSKVEREEGGKQATASFTIARVANEGKGRELEKGEKDEKMKMLKSKANARTRGLSQVANSCYNIYWELHLGALPTLKMS